MSLDIYFPTFQYITRIGTTTARVYLNCIILCKIYFSQNLWWHMRLKRELPKVTRMRNSLPRAESFAKIICDLKFEGSFAFLHWLWVLFVKAFRGPNGYLMLMRVWACVLAPRGAISAPHRIHPCTMRSLPSSVTVNCINSLALFDKIAIGAWCSKCRWELYQIKLKHVGRNTVCWICRPAKHTCHAGVRIDRGFA